MEPFITSFSLSPTVDSDEAERADLIDFSPSALLSLFEREMVCSRIVGADAIELALLALTV